MKAIIFLALFAVTASCISFLPKQDINQNQARDFFIGFMTGMGAPDRVPHSFQCLSDATNAYKQIADAVNMFQNMTMASFQKAFEQMGEAFKTLQKNCPQTLDEGNNFMQTIVDSFTNATLREEGTKRIMSNILIVAGDLQEGKELLVNQSYFLSGTKFGDIATIYVWGRAKKALYAAAMTNFAVNWKFDNCGDAADPLTVSAVELDVAPSKGTSNGITIKGKVKDHEELNTVNIEVKVGGAHLHSEALSSTDVYDANQDFTYKYNVNIPSFAPSGTYEVSFDIKNINNARVGCVKINFDF